MTETLAEKPAGTPERLREYVDSGGARVRVDHTTSVLQGVKLLGLSSKNGRLYNESALRKAMHLYEGAKVNVNHPEGDPRAPRDYRDRLGVIRQVRMVAGEGLYGSLQFNPKHPLAEQLAWDAENAPENVGLSHNVLARTRRDGNAVVVESIDKVHSVDLVADPATTKGLFEEASPVGHNLEKGCYRVEWDRLTLSQIELHRPDLLVEIAEEHQSALAKQLATIGDLQNRHAEMSRRQRITDLLVEYELPLPTDRDDRPESLTSAAFLESLVAAPDDEAVEKLVADRAHAIREAALLASPVIAREQTLASENAERAPSDAAGFVKAISRRGAAN